MAFVAAKCTQCGASIEVDDSQDAGNCRHCGTAFVTQKVINNYNTYITQNITNKFEKETILWSGGTGMLGGVMFAAKVILFIILIFEIAFTVISAFFDVGLGDKLKTFGVLQAGLIIPLIIFPVMCFQIMGVRYTITNERISFIFGMSDWNFFQYREIADIKIKYAFYERSKKLGTIKIRLYDNRFRPFRNHLRSIREPEKVYAIIKSFINK